MVSLFGKAKRPFQRAKGVSLQRISSDLTPLEPSATSSAVQLLAVVLSCPAQEPDPRCDGAHCPAGLFCGEPGSSLIHTKQIRGFTVTRTQQICTWTGTVVF